NETKRIYVWFEAVMGYLTATKEWYRRSGRSDGWKDFWYDPKARHLYFVGKDNIVFHTLFWPAILMGYDEKLALPYDVAATQYLNFSGERMSTGRGSGIWLPELLERFDPDQIRYYGIATMPETKDTDFEWADFERRNNNELLAIYGTSSTGPSPSRTRTSDTRSRRPRSSTRPTRTWSARSSSRLGRLPRTSSTSTSRTR